MSSVCTQKSGRLNLAVVFSLTCLFFLAAVLVFPTNSQAFFHENFNFGKNFLKIAPVPASSPSPKVLAGNKSQKSPLANFFSKTKKAKNQTARRPVKPKATGAGVFDRLFASFNRSLALGPVLWPVGNLAGVHAQPQQVAGTRVGQVLGAQDTGESIVGRVLGGIGGVLAAVGDFLWPFDGEDESNLADKTNQSKTAKATPLASPAASLPSELAQTGELDVVEAADNSQVTVVAVPDTITNSSLTIAGNLTIGDATSDKLVVKSSLDSDLLPSTTGKYNLGSGAERFKALNADNVYLGGSTYGSGGITFEGDTTIGVKDGSSKSLRLDSDSGILYLAPGTNTIANSDNAQPITIDPQGSNQIQFHSSANFITSAGNMTIAGTLTSGSGSAVSSDSLDLTPSTNIDALDITGTNITTASLIDLDPTGTTSGNIIDIDTSTAHSGHVISVDNTGNAVWTGNIIDVTTGTGDASGDVFKMTFEAGATDVQGIVLANAAATDQAGWFVNVDTTGAFTASMFQFDSSGNVAWTGNLFDVDSGTGNYSGDVLNVFLEASTNNDGQVLVVVNDDESDQAGWLANVDAQAAFTSSMISFDSTTNDIWTGNLINVTTGTGDVSGDIVNLTFEAGATDVQGVVIANAAASDQAGWFANIGASGIYTSDVISFDNTGNTATSGDFIAFTTGTGDADGDVMDITIELGATSTQIFDVNNAAVSDEAGWLLEVDTTGAWTGNMIDIALGAQASTGDIINVSMGSTNVGGGVFVIADAGGARTDALIDITSASTGSAADAAAIFQINSTGDLDDLANVIDINMSGGTNANVIDITTLTTAFTGNMVDLNFGNIADTGDAINISHGAAAVGIQAMVVGLTAAGLTNTSGIFDIDLAAGNAAVDGINLSLTGNDGIADDTDIEAMVISITANDVTADMFGLRIVNAATAAAVGADDTECLLCLDNAENTASVLSDAIRITNSGATDAAILTAIDIDTTGVVTDIELQNAETIANDTDDMVIFTGAGGTDNTDLQIDLDGTRPVISSPTDSVIEIAEDVEISGSNLFLALDNEAGRDFALCTAADDGGATPGTTLQEVDDCDAAANPDYAEQYPTDGSAGFGDVMALGTKQVVTNDGNTILQLVKSTSSYQRSLVGVISDNTGQFSSTGYNVPESENPMMIALVGRVPVKVTGEGGAIVEGDYLTTSSTPGHAMRATRAGPVVGMALQSFDCGSQLTVNSEQSTNNCQGQVMAFIKAAWYDPVEEQKRAVLAALGLGSGSVLGVSTGNTPQVTGDTQATGTNPLVGPAADGSLGVLAEEVDLLVHGLLTANNLKVTTAAEFAGTLVVKGLATFEGDLVVKGAFSTGSLDLSGALTKTMTAGSDLSAGDPVVVVGANTVARAGGPAANVVGLAASSASSGGSVKVAVAGTVGGYSGLATGARYYVGSGGVVTTAPGGDRAVHIGIAISGSEMIVQIFESTAPPAPPVVDTATVDTGPTVAVSDGTEGTEGTNGTEGTGPAATPAPEPSPVASPTSTEAGAGGPEPTVTPEASPAPSPEPSPSL